MILGEPLDARRSTLGGVLLVERERERERERTRTCFLYRQRCHSLPEGRHGVAWVAFVLPEMARHGMGGWVSGSVCDRHYVRVYGFAYDTHWCCLVVVVC